MKFRIALVLLALLTKISVSATNHELYLHQKVT